MSASSPHEMKSSTSHQAGTSRTFLKTMYFTSGAKVSTSRSRSAGSPVSRYSCQRASVCSCEMRWEFEVVVGTGGSPREGAGVRGEDGDGANIGVRANLVEDQTSRGQSEKWSGGHSTASGGFGATALNSCSQRPTTGGAPTPRGARSPPWP